MCTIFTTKNIAISPNFLVWKFCGKEQVPHSFGRIVQNYAETVPFHKISTPGNQVKLRYFSQCTVNKSCLRRSNATESSVRAVAHNSFLSVLLSLYLIKTRNQFRISHFQVLFKTDVLRNLAKFTGRYLCWSLFLINSQGINLKLY